MERIMNKECSIISIMILILTAGLASSVSADPKGDAIAAKYDGRVKAADTSSTVVMTLYDPSGNAKKTRELEMYTKSIREGDYRLMDFKGPADIAGTKILVTPPTNGNQSEQRLYLPILKKTRKIASSDKGSEFVNSDFFYQDIEDLNITNNYTNKFVAEGVTLPEFPGMKFYCIEVISKKSDTPYARSLFWISQENNNLYKIDSYDKKDGVLLKTVLFSKFEEQKGALVPVVYSAFNHKKGTKTIGVVSNLKVNTGLPDSFFSVQKLEK